MAWLAPVHGINQPLSRSDSEKPFLAKKGHPAEKIEAMHRAWCKMVLLNVTVWSRAYVAEADW